MLSGIQRGKAMSSGGIDGTVNDQTGSTLPGVTVTASSPALQVAQLTTVSDAEGHYHFIDLPRGTYQVKFELQGFKSVERDDIIEQLREAPCAHRAGTAQNSSSSHTENLQDIPNLWVDSP